MFRKRLVVAVCQILVMLFIVRAFGIEFQTEYLRIVENGHARAMIFISPQASESVSNAAGLLGQYLNQSTRAHLPIHHYQNEEQHVGTTHIAIHVGLTAYVESLNLQYDTLDDDGFLITFPDQQHIVIAGPTDWGTEFGIYEFLERYVGVRWLLPGPDGEYIPELATLDIPMRDIRQEPAFFSRQLSGLANETQKLWARRNRMRSRIQFHHNLANLFPPTQYTSTNPEFFPMRQGQRYLPYPNQKTQWQPCFSAPGLVEEAIKNITAYFAEHPEATSYSLGVNDSGGYCECDICQKRILGKTNFLGLPDHADLYFEWANAVVTGVLKTYPDKWFGCLAYSNVAQPPSFALHRRIIPYMTYDRMKWIDPQFEQEGHRITELWQRQTMLSGWYDYISGMWYLLPRVYFHKMAEYYQYGYAHGVRVMYAGASPNWGEGPKLYLALKLQWNPDLNVDQVLQEWYECAVGKNSAPDLARYYAFWENFWTTHIQASQWFQHNGQYLPFARPDYLSLVTYEDIATSRHLLESVLAKTQTPQQQARAKLLLRAFEYYEASAISYLGLVQKKHYPELTKEDFKQFNRKRQELIDIFRADPVLCPPVRFDLNRYPRLQWE